MNRPPPSPRRPPRGRAGWRKGLFLLLAASAALSFVLKAWPAWPLTVAAGLVVLALVPWRRLHPGPLFFYDLLRLSRRGRSTLLRCTYALALLTALGVTYVNRFPLYDLFSEPFGDGPIVTHREKAVLSADFVAAVLFIQVAAILVVTPAYLAGAIAEEKERRTLPLLFGSHLEDREIVLGKLFSRLAHLAGVLLAGFPVLAVALVLGGADARFVPVGAAVSLLTLLSVGGVSIFFSVRSDDVLGAVLSSYTAVALIALVPVLVPGGGTVSPLAFLLDVEREMGSDLLRRMIYGMPYRRRRGGPGGNVLGLDTWALLAGYALFHLGVAVVATRLAIARLRAQRGQDGAAPRGPRPPARPPTGPRPAPRPGANRFPVSDRPLLWKELYHRAPAAVGLKFWQVYFPVLGAGLVLVELVVALTYPWNFHPELFRNKDPAEAVRLFFRRNPDGVTPPEEARQRFLSDGVNPALRGLALGLTAAWCLCLSLRAAASVARERDQRTLAGLLPLPLPRWRLLAVKWWAAVARYRYLGYAALAVWTVGVLAGAVHPVGALLAMVAAAVHVIFLASLALFLSVACRNAFWAIFSTVLMLMLVFLGWGVVMIYARVLFGTTPGEVGWWSDFVQFGLNPARSWWYLGMSWRGYEQEVETGDPLGHTFGAALAGLAFFAVAAVALWFAACWRFRREQG